MYCSLAEIAPFLGSVWNVSVVAVPEMMAAVATPFFEMVGVASERLLRSYVFTTAS